MTLLRMHPDNNATLYILFIVLRVVATTRVIFANFGKTAWFPFIYAYGSFSRTN